MRKTGKTSVLFAMQRRLNAQSVLVEYVDCQNPGIHSARWWEVLDGIAERCRDGLHRQQRRTAQRSGDYTQANAGNRFLADMRSLLSDGGLDHLVILFDEIEYITPHVSGALGKHWDHDFLPLWQTIRSVHHEVQGRFTFVVAGVNPASVTTTHFGTLPNPIFQLVPALYLQPMHRERVREMVRTIGRYSGLNIDESVYAHLTDLYGGHPFLIRLACSEVWTAANVRDPERRQVVTAQSFHALRPRIQTRLQRPIKDILLSLVWWYPEEYELLRILAEGDASFVEEYLADDPASILKLANYGLLTSDGKSFAIEDVKSFLQSDGAAYKNEISTFHRGDMPPELLPEVPDLAALSRLFELRTSIELLLRRAILMYLGVRLNWDNTEISKAMQKGLRPRSDRRSDVKELFVGRTPQDVANDLYTTELKDIIIAQWDVFSPLFGGNRSRFEMNMDTLNKARRSDAHAKPIPSADAENISNSYAWLRARLLAIPGIENPESPPNERVAVDGATRRR